MDGPASTMEPMTEWEDTTPTEPAQDEVHPAAETDIRPDEVREIRPQRVVEAILFAADSPMPAPKIAAVLGVGSARDVRKHIEELNAEYAEHGLAFRIENIADGYQMLTLPAYNTWLKKLIRTRQETKLSPAALETLAIVAYKQPCTRADIEAVRGVAAGDLLNRLREMNLAKIVGRAEDLGRPLLYGTTKRFLQIFGLPSLEDLPQIEALTTGDAPTADAPVVSDAQAEQDEPAVSLTLVEQDETTESTSPVEQDETTAPVEQDEAAESTSPVEEDATTTSLTLVEQDEGDELGEPAVTPEDIESDAPSDEDELTATPGDDDGGSNALPQS
ncbi:MAG: SMC-Scp complex subunit ScpB [Planctomycetota bacterium]